MLTKRRVFDREAGLGTEERANEVRQDGKTATHGLQRSENSRASWPAGKRVKCFLDLLLANHRCRIRRRNAPDNFALLRKIAVNLLKREKTSKRGIEGKRKKAAWGQDYLLTVLNAAATDSDD